MNTSEAQKVLLVIVEGLDSISLADVLPANMEMLRQAGAGSLSARVASNLTPTAHLCNALTSKAPFRCAEHNLYPAEAPCSLINHAKRNGLSVAVFHNRATLNQLLDEGAVDDFCYLNGSLEDYDFKMVPLQPRASVGFARTFAWSTWDGAKLHKA